MNSKIKFATSFLKSVKKKPFSLSCVTYTRQKVISTVILSRVPIITMEKNQFELQYYKYKNELWRRLMLTFPKWFFFKNETSFKAEFEALNPDQEQPEDNVTFPRGRPIIVKGRDLRFKQDIKLPTQKKSTSTVEDENQRHVVPFSRITEFDKNKDMTSPIRLLDRTLYLVIKSNDKWVFPSFEEASSESEQPLHQLIFNGLKSMSRNNINLFSVSKVPCFYQLNSANSNEFFFKFHIVSGIFKPKDDLLKYLWLTKEQLNDYFEEKFMQSIMHMLSDV